MAAPSGTGGTRRQKGAKSDEQRRAVVSTHMKNGTKLLAGFDVHRFSKTAPKMLPNVD